MQRGQKGYEDSLREREREREIPILDHHLGHEWEVPLGGKIPYHLGI